MWTKAYCAVLLILATVVLVSGCGKKDEDWATQGGGSTEAPPTVQRQVGEIVYTELSSSVVNGRLEVYVSTPNMGSIHTIAERTVMGHPEAKDAMSVLFYNPEQTPIKDVPIHRIDWTKAGGYKKAF